MGLDWWVGDVSPWRVNGTLPLYGHLDLLGSGMDLARTTIRPDPIFAVAAVPLFLK